MSVRLYKATVLLLVIVPLAATIAAIVLLWNRYVFWTDITLLIVLYALTGAGITVGYHRMLTHKSFDAPEWLRMLILICGAAAFEGSPIGWAARHVEHHAHSDEEEDPHSPLHGFWHAHFGWLYTIQHHNPDVQTYAPDVLNDKTVVFVDKYTPVWMGLSLLIPYLIGGWTGLLWGGGVRIFLVTHITWSVNSICHTFGRRDFETSDESRNNWLIGLLGFGEGWHNNHHAFPDSAMHGLRWWQFDTSGLSISVLEKLGLAWNVRRVPIETQKAHAEHSARLQESRLSVLQELEHHLKDARKELLALRAAGIEKAHDSLKRLQDIQSHITLATHLKHQRLQRYIKEVSVIVQQCKAHKA